MFSGIPRESIESLKREVVEKAEKSGFPPFLASIFVDAYARIIQDVVSIMGRDLACECLHDMGCSHIFFDLVAENLFYEVHNIFLERVGSQLLFLEKIGKDIIKKALGVEHAYN